MKLTIAIAVLFVATSCYAAENCSKSCVDDSKECPLVKQFCERDSVKAVCRKTCGECISCVETVKAVKCEIDTCKDSYTPLVCNLYKSFSIGCTVAGNRCRKTCGLCEECELPPTKGTCLKECNDSHSSCNFWKKEGYCNPGKGFPDTQKVCPFSCEVCKLCPPPSFILPPTENKGRDKKEEIKQD